MRLVCFDSGAQLLTPVFFLRICFCFPGGSFCLPGLRGLFPGVVSSLATGLLCCLGSLRFASPGQALLWGWGGEGGREGSGGPYECSPAVEVLQ